MLNYPEIAHGFPEDKQGAEAEEIIQQALETMMLFLTPIERSLLVLGYDRYDTHMEEIMSSSVDSGELKFMDEDDPRYVDQLHTIDEEAKQRTYQELPGLQEVVEKSNSMLTSLLDKTQS